MSGNSVSRDTLSMKEVSVERFTDRTAIVTHITTLYKGGNYKR